MKRILAFVLMVMIAVGLMGCSNGVAQEEHDKPTAVSNDIIEQAENETPNLENSDENISPSKDTTWSEQTESEDQLLNGEVYDYILSLNENFNAVEVHRKSGIVFIRINFMLEGSDCLEIVEHFFEIVDELAQYGTDVFSKADYSKVVVHLDTPQDDVLFYITLEKVRGDEYSIAEINDQFVNDAVWEEAIETVLRQR